MTSIVNYRVIMLPLIKRLISNFGGGGRNCMDLQLSLQSVPIPTKVESSNPVHGEAYSKQHYVIKFVSDFPHQ